MEKFLDPSNRTLRMTFRSGRLVRLRILKRTQGERSDGGGRAIKDAQMNEFSGWRLHFLLADNAEVAAGNGVEATKINLFPAVEATVTPSWTRARAE